MTEPEYCQDCEELERERRAEAEARRLAFLRERRRVERVTCFLLLTLLCGAVCVVGMYVWRLVQR